MTSATISREAKIKRGLEIQLSGEQNLETIGVAGLWINGVEVEKSLEVYRIYFHWRVCYPI